MAGMDALEWPPEARQLLDRATVHETPCGDGMLVWHTWGAGAPLVMLHGGSGSWSHWLRNIETVTAAGRMACVPDLPGFGDSAVPPGARDADGVVEPLADGLRALWGDGPFDIAGFSFGSLAGTLLATQQPAMVSRLLLVGAPVLPLARGKGMALRSWSHLPTQEQRNAVHRHNLAAIMVTRPESIDATALQVQAINVPRDRMLRRKLVTTDAFSQALARLQCPYAAIYGEQDALYRADWTPVLRLLRANPHCEGVQLIPDTGHWVQFEAAAAFNEELARWLAAA
jgi:pimeloyl-ACP methyl ester carboxylesterase